MVRFEVLREGPEGGRTGLLHTPHGTVETPAFMPVGTRASVKGLPPFLLKEAGAAIVLCNTFHLALRPGSGLIQELGGLHRFMGWEGPILTDSGGFQVFSLASLREVSEEGVAFRSPVDGSPLFLSPERAVAVQEELGVDVAMVLDVLVPGGATWEETAAAVSRTSRWAARCREAAAPSTALFGIVQGGTYRDLRERSARDLAALDFPGYAAGGFSVGEKKEAFREVAAYTAGLLPKDRPRYLMGVGTPLDLVEAVSWGYDLFDCVLPTRNARNGSLFTSQGPLAIKNAAFARDPSPLDPACPCWACRHLSRAYLHHLFRHNDPTGLVLHSLHNLTFYLGLLARIREAIAGGGLAALQEEVRRDYGREGAPAGGAAWEPAV
ncbi:MAG: tRNA guanosine(34) transglycosylase Tgt [Acidobacteriota bacterium]